MSEEKNWRDMSEEERAAIQDQVLMRQLEEQNNLLADQRRRALEIVQQSPNGLRWSIADLQLFIRRVNAVAVKHNCLDKLPTKPYPSREAFLEDAVGVLIEGGATQEEIDSIFALNQQVNESKY